MAAEIVQLKTTIDSDKESVIEVLENALEQAKEGSIQNIAIALVRPNGALNTCWSDNDSGTVSQVLGAIGLLQHRLIERLEEGCEQG